MIQETVTHLDYNLSDIWGGIMLRLVKILINKALDDGNIFWINDTKESWTCQTTANSINEIQSSTFKDNYENIIYFIPH